MTFKFVSWMGMSVWKSTVAEYSTHPSSSSTLGTFVLNISMKASRSEAFTEMDAITFIIFISQACKRMNTRGRVAVFQGVLTVAAMGLQSDRIVHGLEQQPCGVQVVEWVGLGFLVTFYACMSPRAQLHQSFGSLKPPLFLQSLKLGGLPSRMCCHRFF